MSQDLKIMLLAAALRSLWLTAVFMGTFELTLYLLRQL